MRNQRRLVLQSPIEQTNLDALNIHEIESRTLLEHFNIALLPTNPDFAQECTKLAQVNFAHQASGYILGTNSLPHLTLAQFQCQSEAVESVWSAIRQFPELKLRLSGIYVRPGKGQHNGHRWVGFSVFPSVPLVELQNRACAILSSNEIKSTTDPSTYFPHITWARVPQSEIISITTHPSESVWNDEHEYSISIGLSTDLGVYKRSIYPSA